MAADLLDVRDVSVVYRRGSRETRALAGVSLRLQRGEALGVIGETGSGKSTLARTILGLVKPEHGSVRVTGEQVSDFNARQWTQFRRKGVVQYVFQDPLRSLDPDIAVGESIAEPLHVSGQHSTREIAERVARSMQRLALDPALSERLPAQLSGGQRQRVAIARALITEPQLLILDEPVSALDSANRVQVLTLLSSLRATGTALLFISHDLGSTAGLTDRIIVLYRGALVEDGATAAVVSQPRHPYTQLLVGSAPTLSGGGVPRERRLQLQAALAAHANKHRED